MTRQRSISGLSAVLIDPYHFRLRLTTQAGTYVKEFVHGDFGRTKPNLTIILNRFVDILELDVLVSDQSKTLSLSFSVHLIYISSFRL